MKPRNLSTFLIALVAKALLEWMKYSWKIKIKRKFWTDLSLNIGIDAELVDFIFTLCKPLTRWCFWRQHDTQPRIANGSPFHHQSQPTINRPSNSMLTQRKEWTWLNVTIWTKRHKSPAIIWLPSFELEKLIPSWRVLEASKRNCMVLGSWIETSLFKEWARRPLTPRNYM